MNLFYQLSAQAIICGWKLIEILNQDFLTLVPLYPEIMHRIEIVFSFSSLRIELS